MNILKNILILSASLMVFAACDSDGNGSVTDPSMIDRLGRPAINTALNNTFTDDATRGAAEDRYNSTHNRNGSQFISTFAAHLAIYDSLVDELADANACGDNPFTNLAGTDTSTLATGDSRYNFVATVLADDQLYVVGTETTCSQYLAAEANVALGAGLADCGGRAPSYDVIDVSYSILAAGGLSGVGDGISQTNGDSDTTFPYLAAP